MALLRKDILKRSSRRVVMITAFWCIVQVAGGQAAKEPSDSELPLPKLIVGVHQDASAVAEISAYYRAVGNSSWPDLKASGQIAYDYGSSTESSPATVWLKGSAWYRLDASQQAIHTSLRSGPTYAGASRDGQRERLLSLKQADSGFLLFPRIRPSYLANLATSIIDGGTVQLSTASLHRITIQHPLAMLPDGVVPAQNRGSSETIVMDFYFDMATHLLVKSLVAVSAKGVMDERIPVVTTYSNYKQIDGALVPTMFSQTVHGQHVWTLTLDQIKLSQGLGDETFEK